MLFRSLLVEGGSLIHASFIKSNTVDQLALFLAPKVIGGQESLSWCGNLGVNSVDDAPQMEISSVTALGEDWMISAIIK